MKDNVRVVLCVGLAVGLLVSGASSLAAEPLAMDLSGSWRFEMDASDKGMGDRWFDRALTDEIKLPGALQAQGFGEDIRVDTAWTSDIVDRSYFDDLRYAPYREIGNIKVPFWLQPDKHYVGAAWYQRDLAIPAGWEDMQVTLVLERPHWNTQVWVDEHECGNGEALGMPHRIDLTDVVAAGRTHRLTVRVDNRVVPNVGPNSHSVSEHTQGNWNGIVGEIQLVATPRVWVEDLQVYPQVKDKTTKLRLRLHNTTGHATRGTLTVGAASYNSETRHQAEPLSRPVELPVGENDVKFDYPLGPDAQLWDEFSPALYRLTVRLVPEARAAPHEKTVTFGLREIGTAGTQFTMNGRTIYLRGTLECCIFPLTGYPPTDVKAWKRIIGICKAHGLNHMRFHSWTPPEAAFVAADELGFYFHVECGSWANQGATVGDGKPLDAWLYREGERLIAEYGNHPSFAMMAYGNEPAGPDSGAKYLGPWVEHFKRLDPRRMYTSAAGWPAVETSEYHVTPDPRIQRWGEGIRSRINALPPETVTDYRDFVAKYKVPVVSHEIGQWCVYPNFAEIAKYTGALKAKNFEIFRDFLRANHMGDQAETFLMASGKLQALCYKEEIESALRTPGFGGFQLLDLHDFPGQGTALVGVLDPFWDSKPYISPAEFHRFCGETVPLARMAKRIFMTDETFTADIEIAHFGPKDIDNTPITWRLLDKNRESVDAGALTLPTIPTGALTPVGSIKLSLGDIAAPQKLVFEVALEGTNYANDWDVWVYSAELPTPTPAAEAIHMARELDNAAIAQLERGGTVLLQLPARWVKTDATIGFSTVFWNTAWTRGQSPHTLGILCDPKHPMFASFPTESHTNWQWWDLIHSSAAMVLDGMPAELRPLVQVIDTWFEARRLAIVFEARVGKGKLVVCSIDLDADLVTRPAARQFRCSLLDYMAGKAFEPKHAVTVEQIRALMTEPLLLGRLGATARADSEQMGHTAENAIDGRPETIWHTQWSPTHDSLPHELVIDLQTPQVLAGLTVLPRQDMSNGRIARCEIYVSTDGQSWGQPIARETWPDTNKRQSVRFAPPVTARYIKLVAIEEVRGKSYTSLAEIDVLLAEPR
ncbi:MAG: discoidin domain-containing protein [Phycisphaerae bacterium]|nr:discoidin domain-containing protein [Phycisphaerae bacterium]